MRCGLKEDQALIVFASPGGTSKSEATILSQELLTEEERARRFVSADHRHNNIVARSLLRLGLSACFPVEPAEWGFARDERQKPFVVAPTDLQPFRFSLSHTQGLAALLVTFAPQAGVDVEYLQRSNDLELIAQRVFTPDEIRSLKQLEGDARRNRFFQLWTLKEACSKARGVGLALPFDKLSFAIDSNDNAQVQFADELKDDESAWQFSLRKIGADHILASAVATGFEIDLRRVRVAIVDGKPRLEEA